MRRKAKKRNFPNKHFPAEPFDPKGGKWLNQGGLLPALQQGGSRDAAASICLNFRALFFCNSRGIRLLEFHGEALENVLFMVGKPLLCS